MDASVIGLGVGSRSRWLTEKPPLEFAFVHIAGARPVEPGGAGQSDVLRDHALGNAQRRGDPIVREAAVEFKS